MRALMGRLAGSGDIPGQLRRAVRREPSTCLLRQDDAPSPHQRRRPCRQWRAPHHRHWSAADRSSDQGLCRKAHGRGALQARAHSMPGTPHCGRGVLLDQPTTTRGKSGPSRRLTIRRASVVANMPRMPIAACRRKTTCAAHEPKRQIAGTARPWKASLAA
jgi:hypothetical protein